MKRNSLILLFSAALLGIAVSCAKDDQNPDPVPPPPDPGPEPPSAVVFSGSKELGQWASDDAISLFDGTSVIESVAKTAGASASFEATLSSDGPWYALYPADANASIDGSKIVATLSSEQQAVESSYAAALELSVALSNENALAFKTAVGFIKFVMPSENIKNVKLQGKGGETLAGKVKIDYNGASPTWEAVSGNTSIVLSGTFVKGSTYYFALLPQTFAEGIVLTFTDNDDNETERTVSEEVAVGRAGVYEVSAQEIIAFADPDVKTALLAIPGLDADSDGEISREEAAALTSAQLDEIVGEEGVTLTALWGDDLTVVDSFNELKYFTGLEYIPALFKDCTSLTSVSLPMGATNIRKSCFSGCTSLSAVEFPSSMQQLFANAFKDCTSLTYVSLPSSINKISNSVFQGCSALETADNLGETALTEIGAAAFQGCTSLTAVSIPAGVKNLGNNCFNGCSALATVTGGSGIESIGAAAFKDCVSLTTMTIDKVEKLGQDIFNGCTKLTGVKVSPKLRQIGIQSFLNCTSLTTFSDTGIDDGFHVPAEVTAILRQAFDNCSSLPNPDFSRCHGLDTLENRCFRFCKGFTEIDLPASVTFMVRPFACSKSNPTNITKVTLRAATPPRTSKYTIFEYDATVPTIYVPAESLDDYKTAGTASNPNGHTDSNNYQWFKYSVNFEAIPQE